MIGAYTDGEAKCNILLNNKVLIIRVKISAKTAGHSYFYTYTKQMLKHVGQAQAS